MDEKRLKGLLGLAVRAGQAVFGEDGCRKAIRNGNGGMLLLDVKASENTRRRYEAACSFNGTRMVILPEGLLGEATGKPGAAMYLKEGSFKDQVTGCLNAGNNR